MGKSSFYTRIINISDYIDSSNIESVKTRLFDKSMPEPNTGCFIWIGCLFNGDYGRMWVRDKQIMAHRISYFVHKGEIPEAFVIDHICNHTPCINPQHLEAKTQKDNGYRSKHSPTTINAQKTHCKNGHEFTEENTNSTIYGRRCITCVKKYKSEWYLKKIATKERLKKLNHKK